MERENNPIWPKIKFNDKEISVHLDGDFFAFKDGRAYNVYISHDSCFGVATVGKLRFVLDEMGGVVSVAEPLLNLNNGFQLIDREIVKHYTNVISAMSKLELQKKFKCKTGRYDSQLPSE